MVDRRACRGELTGSVAAAVEAGVDWLQLRERDLDGRPLLELCDELASAARGAARRSGRPLRILVNRRADVALALGADGLHLGFDAVAPSTARELLGDAASVGVSLHDPDEVATADAVDYAHLAPIFAPLSKAQPSRPPLGLGALARAAAGPLPVLAQGGLGADNAAAAVAAGAAGIAVTGAILMDADPAAATARLRRALDAAAPGGSS